MDATLEAARLISEGLDAAAAEPRWGFLVFNGAVHFYNAVRPLQRDGARAHLLPAQEKLCQVGGGACAPCYDGGGWYTETVAAYAGRLLAA